MSVKNIRVPSDKTKDAAVWARFWTQLGKMIRAEGGGIGMKY